MNERLFGEAKPVKAVVKVDAKPQFDFAGELAAAKAAMLAIFKALGGAVPVAVAPTGSAELKSVKIGGVRWVKFEDRDRDIRPFNWTVGYTLSVIAELPGSVLRMSTPGAARSTVVAPQSENEALRSAESVAATEITLPRSKLAG